MDLNRKEEEVHHLAREAVVVTPLWKEGLVMFRHLLALPYQFISHNPYVFNN